MFYGDNTMLEKHSKSYMNTIQNCGQLKYFVKMYTKGSGQIKIFVANFMVICSWNLARKQPNYDYV